MKDKVCICVSLPIMCLCIVQLGWNCLHHAAKNGSLAIAKILLQNNCELNAKDKVRLYIIVYLINFHRLENS